MRQQVTYHPLDPQLARLFACFTLDARGPALATEYCKRQGLDELHTGRLLDLLAHYSLRDDLDFDQTHGFHTAVLHGFFDTYFYVEAAPLSSLGNLLTPYLTSWQALLPDNAQAVAARNTLSGPHSSGIYIAPDQVAQFMADVQALPDVTEAIAVAFPGAKAQVLWAALQHALDNKTGLLEANGVVTPNRADLQTSVCYTKFANCHDGSLEVFVADTSATAAPSNQPPPPTGAPTSAVPPPPGYQAPAQPAPSQAAPVHAAPAQTAQAAPHHEAALPPPPPRPTEPAAPTAPAQQATSQPATAGHTAPAAPADRGPAPVATREKGATPSLAERLKARREDPTPNTDDEPAAPDAAAQGTVAEDPAAVDPAAADPSAPDPSAADPTAPDPTAPGAVAETVEPEAEIVTTAPDTAPADEAEPQPEAKPADVAQAGVDESDADESDLDEADLDEADLNESDLGEAAPPTAEDQAGDVEAIDQAEQSTLVAVPDLDASSPAKTPSPAPAAASGGEPGAAVALAVVPEPAADPEPVLSVVPDLHPDADENPQVDDETPEEDDVAPTDQISDDVEPDAGADQRTTEDGAAEPGDTRLRLCAGGVEGAGEVFFDSWPELWESVGPLGGEQPIFLEVADMAERWKPFSLISTPDGTAVVRYLSSDDRPSLRIFGVHIADLDQLEDITRNGVIVDWSQIESTESPGSFAIPRTHLLAPYMARVAGESLMGGTQWDPIYNDIQPV